MLKLCSSKNSWKKKCEKKATYQKQENHVTTCGPEKKDLSVIVHLAVLNEDIKQSCQKLI